MKAWEQFLTTLEREIGADPVARWLRPLRILRFDAANLYLEANDPMVAGWFEEHVRPRIKQGLFNENHRPIRVHLESGSREKKLNSYPSNELKIQSDLIEPVCLLSNFCEHLGNQIASKLIREWVKKGTALFNPIFLFGPKASGKTHLLMGTAEALSKLGKKVFYVKADTFTEHVVQAIRGSRMLEFRTVYREIDVLLVDDIDHLAGRAATQEEFFHTFNALHTAGKQIVLTSQLPPSKIQEIEPRLISRFEWGISLGLDKAPIEEVIRLKAKAWNIPLDEPLLAFLIVKFPTDPILALQALAVRGTSTQPVSVAVAEKILGDLLKTEAVRAVTPERIVKALSTHFGITTEDLIGKSQAREFALPRQIAMYVCRQKLNMPFQAIGKFFGRDHSTVMSSVKLIQKGIEENNREWVEAAEAASKL